MPAHVDELSQLAVGEITSLVETRVGFDILVRREIPAGVEPKEYAAATIHLQYYDHLPDTHAHSRKHAEELARKLIAEIELNPSAFEELQKTYAGVTDPRWRYGGNVALERQLDALAIGEVTAQPIAALREFIIAKRLDPTFVEARKLVYELPAPTMPDLDVILRGNTGEAISVYLREIRSRGKTLALSAAHRDVFEKAYGSLIARMESYNGMTDDDASARVAAFHENEAHLASALEGEYPLYRGFFERFVRAAILGTPM